MLMPHDKESVWGSRNVSGDSVNEAVESRGIEGCDTGDRADDEVVESGIAGGCAAGDQTGAGGDMAG